MESYSNELIHESSLYLQQHAHNPVNWFPWSEKVFELARNQKKLVVISIGYSSCHWCHVMEQESFEDEEVAAIMNKHFVCVKVDREERPDIDQVYMTAVQLMTQRGGWPLNCITLPDGRPIYGGTYFPKEQWMHILKSLVYTYENELSKVIEYAEKLHQGIQQSELVHQKVISEEFSIEKIHELVQRWESRMDFENGGSGAAPKFPLPNNLEFLYQYASHYPNNTVHSFLHLSLQKMAQGGIYDQIGGGFSRYSVDSSWKIPHFEKMLYDNAQLLSIYAQAYQQQPEPEYERIINQTVLWLKREMKAGIGCFYASQDADSEGEEGKYYTWNQSEIQSILGNVSDTFLSLYNPNNKAIWEHNQLVLQRNESWKQWLKNHPKCTSATIQEQLDLLLKQRLKRIKPVTDQKCITSWNAMLATGLMHVYQATNQLDAFDLATKIMSWIKQVQIKQDEVYRIVDEKNQIAGFLDDYACIIQALIHYYQLVGNSADLELAIRLSDNVIERFQNSNSPLFNYTSNPNLIAHSVEVNDNVIPSSNSIMANNLWSLALLAERSDFEKKAKQMLGVVFDDMSQYGSGYSNWALLALRIIQGVKLVHLPTTKSWESFKKQASSFVLIQPTNDLFATVCVNGACSLPIENAADLLEKI